MTIKYKSSMTYIEIIGPNSNFFVKKGQYRMMWLEKYVYC